jgi:hypothetical protein
MVMTGFAADVADHGMADHADRDPGSHLSEQRGKIRPEGR